MYIFIFCSPLFGLKHTHAQRSLPHCLSVPPLSVCLLIMASSQVKTVDERVAMTAPIINDMIEAFEPKKGIDGVQTFQQELLKTIRGALLSDDGWYFAKKVGVHPDNREKCGLVPIDVHDLLNLIAAAGWSWTECEGALASEIPPNEIGGKWRAFNVALAEKSDGLLPVCDGDMLEIVSARGSHTTACVRCMVIGSKGIHEVLCTDGMISQSKIVERQPSMAEPITNGMKYNVIVWQLVVACPRLMEVLSRTGNCSHGVARTQTALQGCKRVHDLANNMNESADLWDNVACAASIGMPPGYVTTAKAYCCFVQQWAGGKDGRVLDELVAYERVLSFKRRIMPADLKALGEIKFLDGPRYVPAMVKAMLLSPPNFVENGTSKLFSQNDYAQLASAASKIKKLAQEAHRCMTACHSFFDAYSTLTGVEKMKIIGELEVRCVMLAHAKKSATRSDPKTFAHIAPTAYELAAEKMRADGRSLPQWDFIKHLQTPEPSAVPTSAIREFDSEGTISDADMLSHGFKVGAVIVKRIAKDHKAIHPKDQDPEEFPIVDASAQQVALHTIFTEDRDYETVKTHRAELLNHYKVKVIEKIEYYKFGEYFNPSQSKELAHDIAKGVAKSIIR